MLWSTVIDAFLNVKAYYVILIGSYRIFSKAAQEKMWGHIKQTLDERYA